MLLGPTWPCNVISDRWRRLSGEVPAKSLALIENLKLVIEKYRRMIFGRKSEKLTAQLKQLEFRLEELETAQAADEASRPSGYSRSGSLGGSCARRSVGPSLLARFSQRDKACLLYVPRGGWSA